MTVTEIGESYAPLKNAEVEGEGRASSEESRREIPPGAKPDSGWGAPVSSQVPTKVEESWIEQTQNGNGRTPEELAPLNNFEIAGSRGDPENARALIGQQTMNKFEPPDGGSRAWSVMVASFFVNGIFFGVINSYSIIFSELKMRLEKSGDMDAAFKACELLFNFFVLLVRFFFFLPNFQHQSLKGCSIVTSVQGGLFNGIIP